MTHIIPPESTSSTVSFVKRKFHSFLHDFYHSHPYFCYGCAFLGVPIFVLTVVSLGTLVVIYPIARIFGWL